MTTPNTNSTNEVEPGDLKRVSEQGETLGPPERIWIDVDEHALAVRNNDVGHYFLTPDKESVEYRRAAVAGPPEALKRATNLCRSGVAGERRTKVELVFDDLKDAQAVHQWLATLKTAAASSATPVNPWAKLIGKYKDDPTWQEFDAFLKEHREEIDRAYAESLVAPPESTVAGEREQRLLTPEELADIERFQRQRRKSPVAADAWLYVAEIDRLLSHIRLGREQLENEIFQDATDPAFATTSTSDNARRAANREQAQEIVIATEHRLGKKFDALARHELADRIAAALDAAAPAGNEAESVALTIPTCGDCPFVDHSGAFTPGGAKAICGHRNAVETFAANVEGDDRYHWKYRQVDREAAPPARCPLRPENAHTHNYETIAGQSAPQCVCGAVRSYDDTTTKGAR